MKEFEKYSTVFQNYKNSLPYKLNYKTITGILTLRNKLYSPESILEEIEIKKGMKVLDFGCGPGTFSLTASKIVGDGIVYAVDKEKFGLQILAKKIKKEGIKNISIINSDCKINLSDNSIDVILLYYVFNDLKNPFDVLRELHRVLKPNGVLSFFEFNQNKISKKLQQFGWFGLQKQGIKTHTFVKNEISLKKPESNPPKLQNSAKPNGKKIECLVSKKNMMLMGILAIVGYSMVLPWSGVSYMADADNDGLMDQFDNCPMNPNPDQEDYDFDNTGDECDVDDDNDGIIDELDMFDYDSSEWSDFDADSIGDNKDEDDDNDGIIDELDMFDNDPLK